MGIGDGATLRVDPELLSQYGGELEAAAKDLPDAPPPFVVTGTDAISTAIAGKLPDIEGKIQESLPQIKTDAVATASNIVSAAGKYKGTDEQLAAEYEKHQFDAAGSSGGGAAGSAGGGGDAMSQMGQMMSMPMQMASQAAQMPMKAMSAVASVPQAVMQGVQQIGQMVGGLGKSDGDSPDAQADAAEQKDQEQKDDEQKKQESQLGAAGGTAYAERAPEPSAVPAVPQPSSPRHAAPDPQVNL
jgi:hypothetical protein